MQRSGSRGVHGCKGRACESQNIWKIKFPSVIFCFAFVSESEVCVRGGCIWGCLMNVHVGKHVQ